MSIRMDKTLQLDYYNRMDIPRHHAPAILSRMEKERRIVVLYGPRQSGKTTLAERIIATAGQKCLKLNGDTPQIAEALIHPDQKTLEGLVAGYPWIFLDEAQRIPDIGLTLKRLHDTMPKLRLLVTGSSSLELAAKTKEALTGRTWTYILFPIAFCELAQIHNNFELNEYVPEVLVLGSYPALFSIPNRQDRIAHLQELCAAYLYKDILDLSGLRNPRKLRDLLRLLAYQVGNEVSYSELATRVGLSVDTVISYVDLLEKSFVVFRLGAFSRNLRKEISKKDKIYFFDNGIRNALIEDFKPLNSRGDVGALWENFLVSERRKWNHYRGFYGSAWFWRVHTGAEVDYVEEQDSSLSCFEFKWNKTGGKMPKGFADTYPNSQFALINRDNYLSFLK